MMKLYACVRAHARTYLYMHACTKIICHISLNLAGRDEHETSSENDCILRARAHAQSNPGCAYDYADDCRACVRRQVQLYIVVAPSSMINSARNKASRTYFADIGGAGEFFLCLLCFHLGRNWNWQLFVEAHFGNINRHIEADD